MSDRVCQRPSCGKSLQHQRSDARFCGPICRRAALRERESQPEGTKPFDWLRFRAHRRARAAKRGREQ